MGNVTIPTGQAFYKLSAKKTQGGGGGGKKPLLVLGLGVKHILLWSTITCIKRCRSCSSMLQYFNCPFYMTLSKREWGEK